VSPKNFGRRWLSTHVNNQSAENLSKAKKLALGLALGTAISSALLRASGPPKKFRSALLAYFSSDLRRHMQAPGKKAVWSQPRVPQ